MALDSVLGHVGWESADEPLEDETRYYLQWAIDHVSYPELLVAS